MKNQIERRGDYPIMVEKMKSNGEALITLKEYFESRLDHIEKSTELARVLLEKVAASDKTTLDKRFEAVNEFRQMVQDQQLLFITKIEHKAVVYDINDLKESRAELRGKANQSSVTWATVIAVISIAIALIGLAMTYIRDSKIESVSYGYQDYIKQKDRR